MLRAFSCINYNTPACWQWRAVYEWQAEAEMSSRTAGLSGCRGMLAAGHPTPGPGATRALTTFLIGQLISSHQNQSMDADWWQVLAEALRVTRQHGGSVDGGILKPLSRAFINLQTKPDTQLEQAITDVTRQLTQPSSILGASLDEAIAVVTLWCRTSLEHGRLVASIALQHLIQHLTRLLSTDATPRRAFDIVCGELLSLCMEVAYLAVAKSLSQLASVTTELILDQVIAHRNLTELQHILLHSNETCSTQPEGVADDSATDEPPSKRLRLDKQVRNYTSKLMDTIYKDAVSMNKSSCVSAVAFLPSILRGVCGLRLEADAIVEMQPDELKAENASRTAQTAQSSSHQKHQTQIAMFLWMANLLRECTTCEPEIILKSLERLLQSLSVARVLGTTTIADSPTIQEIAEAVSKILVPLSERFIQSPDQISIQCGCALALVWDAACQFHVGLIGHSTALIIALCQAHYQQHLGTRCEALQHCFMRLSATYARQRLVIRALDGYITSISYLTIQQQTPLDWLAPSLHFKSLFGDLNHQSRLVIWTTLTNDLPDVSSVQNWRVTHAILQCCTQLAATIPEYDDAQQLRSVQMLFQRCEKAAYDLLELLQAEQIEYHHAITAALQLHRLTILWYQHYDMRQHIEASFLSFNKVIADLTSMSKLNVLLQWQLSQTALVHINLSVRLNLRSSSCTAESLCSWLLRSTPSCSEQCEGALWQLGTVPTTLPQLRVATWFAFWQSSSDWVPLLDDQQLSSVCRIATEWCPTCANHCQETDQGSVTFKAVSHLAMTDPQTVEVRRLMDVVTQTAVQHLGRACSTLLKRPEVFSAQLLPEMLGSLKVDKRINLQDVERVVSLIATAADFSQGTWRSVLQSPNGQLVMRQLMGIIVVTLQVVNKAASSCTITRLTAQVRLLISRAFGQLSDQFQQTDYCAFLKAIQKFERKQKKYDFTCAVLMAVLSSQSIPVMLRVESLNFAARRQEPCALSAALQGLHNWLTAMCKAQRKENKENQNPHSYQLPSEVIPAAQSIVAACQAYIASDIQSDSSQQMLLLLLRLGSELNSNLVAASSLQLRAADCRQVTAWVLQSMMRNQEKLPPHVLPAVAGSLSMLKQHSDPAQFRELLIRTCQACMCHSIDDCVKACSASPLLAETILDKLPIKDAGPAHNTLSNVQLMHAILGNVSLDHQTISAVADTVLTESVSISSALELSPCLNVCNRVLAESKGMDIKASDINKLLTPLCRALAMLSNTDTPELRDNCIKLLTSLVSNRAQAIPNIVHILIVALDKIHQGIMCQSAAKNSNENLLYNLERLYSAFSRLPDNVSRQCQRAVPIILHSLVSHMCSPGAKRVLNGYESRSASLIYGCLFNVISPHGLKTVHVQLPSTGQMELKQRHAVHLKTTKFYGHI